MATAGMPMEPTLADNARADVCIIGAGIAGMTTAYLLAREGKSVVVLDDGPIGGGMTGRTTAHLTNAFDDRYYEVERLHGLKNASLAAESHTAAIDRIEAIVSEEDIDCDFERVNGYLFAAQGDSADVLELELAAAHRAGLPDVYLTERAPLDSFDTGPSLCFPNQAQFHPMKYLAGLARAIKRCAGRIFSGTHVTRIEGGASARIETSRGFTVTADSVVVATNTPINNRIAIHTKQAPYRTYAIGARIPCDAVTKALYWDTGDPYHYVRLETSSRSSDAASGNVLLLVGGEDHKLGQADDGERRYAQLETWARERFPAMQQVEFRWSGVVMEPIDYFAFIGRNPLDHPNVYIVTGDSGEGIMHGTIAGILLTDMIYGRENPWTAIYDPARITAGAALEFAKENLNVAAQFADYLTMGDVTTAEEIVPGEGAVIRAGLTKIAAYRDLQGTLHQRSAVCRHLGCIVAWNSTEKTWDCPCHGARYDAYGTVINGPATRDLAPINN